MMSHKKNTNWEAVFIIIELESSAAACKGKTKELFWTEGK